MDSSYILFKGNKRLTLKEDDMIGDKIARIFQVYAPSLYITDDDNVAIFPGSAGHFSCLDLRPRGHYEVHGDDIGLPVAEQTHPLSGQNRFQFHRTAQPTAALGSPAQAVAPTPPRASMSNTFQRSVFIAELSQGKLKPARMVVLRLFEFEATTTGILAKIHDALQSDDPLILTDAQGNEIVDSEGTRGSKYWKQNAKKFLAVPENIFHEFQQGTKGKKLSHKDMDSTSLQEVHDKIEEVILAAQGLSEVTTVIKDLSKHASNTTGAMLVLTHTMITHVKDAFGCIVCKGLMEEPVMAVCCKSFVGCKNCVDQWMLTSDQCLKCRADEFSVNAHRLISLDNVLSILGGVIKM
ncbi:uncharacterized protein LOC130184574 [Seriola aureovittata]|uniref:uncharacterized protein LOC130184574 n=1 Tax=Seriola aureovittata TaxID=2871759 RepID=UPI0024BEA569|nr:uncharacterized protein LOC130184574 [Seriola aureovittata]